MTTRIHKINISEALYTLQLKPSYHTKYHTERHEILITFLGTLSYHTFRYYLYKDYMLLQMQVDNDNGTHLAAHNEQGLKHKTYFIETAFIFFF